MSAIRGKAAFEAALAQSVSEDRTAACQLYDKLHDPDALRLDYFIEPGRLFLQNRRQFCINSDSAALALFVRSIRNKRVLEIGCNNGAILLWLDRYNPSFLCGVELQEDPAALARLNLSLFAKNDWDIVEGDIQQVDAGTFDLVLCNPPYFPLPADLDPESLDSRQKARFETDLGLEKLFKAARRHLKDGGRFCLVHRPDRISELFKALGQENFAISRLQIAYDARTSKASAILVEAVLNGTCATIIEEPLWYDGTSRPKSGLAQLSSVSRKQNLNRTEQKNKEQSVSEEERYE